MMDAIGTKPHRFVGCFRRRVVRGRDQHLREALCPFVFDAERQNSNQFCIQVRFCFCGFPRIVGGQGRVAGLNRVFEGGFFVGCVGPDGGHQVGGQIVSHLQQHIDAAPGFNQDISPGDETIEAGYGGHGQRDRNDQENPHGAHGGQYMKQIRGISLPPAAEIIIPPHAPWARTITTLGHP